MKNSVQNKTSNHLGRAQLASLGARHGYRFEGDVVCLNAMFLVHDAAAHQHGWALQLWACPAGPRNAAEVAGHLVAEIPLPPIGEIADENEGFEVSGIACPPVGRAGHVMVLVLAAGQAGQYSDVQDFAIYQRPEVFSQPRMVGSACYRIQGDRVVVEVEQIENPRDAANRSGTLALELWALAGQYRGGSFQGVPLAGVAFDGLAGQCEYRQSAFNLSFVPPPAGSWNLVMMLREWTAAGFITRDYVNFAEPYTVAPPSVGPADLKTKSVATSKAAPAAKCADALVSVNSASKAELASIKGMPTKVVEGIVSKRPFRSLEELTKVKGMGEKLFAKLRSKLRL
jgi:competence ComEA-like helix-hairpin-helix protein